jgi:uncharacterized membrane protein
VNKRTYKQLLDDLPELVEKGLLSGDQSTKISEYYAGQIRNRPNVALISFSIIGSVLLASGLILILAHNWSDLPRFVKTILSFSPLVVSQAIAAWVFLKKRDSIPWTEGIAAFAFLSIGATIALISQTYHIKGDLPSYLMTWMLLGLPLAYFFRSTTAGVFYIAGITAWMVAQNWQTSNALPYWLFLVGIIPLYFIEYKASSISRQTSLLGWFLAISFAFAGFCAVEDITEWFRIIVLISLFLSLYALGIILFPDSESMWKVPFHRAGILGLSALYIFLSYRGAWEHLSFGKVENLHGFLLITNNVISIGLVILAILLSVIACRKKLYPTFLFAAGLPLALLGFALAGNKDTHGFLTILFNLYVFGTGVAYLVHGIRENAGKALNFGFLLIAAIVILRFFDSDLSFVIRGVFFVVLGAGFLSANLFIAKRKGR